MCHCPIQLEQEAENHNLFYFFIFRNNRVASHFYCELGKVFFSVLKKNTWKHRYRKPICKGDKRGTQWNTKQNVKEILF